MKLVELLEHATSDYPEMGQMRKVMKAKELIQEKGADETFRKAFNKCDENTRQKWLALYKERGCMIQLEYAGERAVNEGFHKTTIQPRVYDSGAVAVIKFTTPVKYEF